MGLLWRGYLGLSVLVTTALIATAAYEHHKISRLMKRI